ncbi:MAG: thioredoxin domain-containing protein [Flavobacteriaceae bacterium]|nr:thioredoxin domain-containing protein [Eudoraea sp.]NNJ38491.1 thioredoxin domain-containing protein [Flavobacteriaceae bacterium]
MSHKYTNALVHETSPYLLQHAHNPVNWEAWSPEVLKRAQDEGKLLLISIGYAACHWCHVMEKECFEDEEVAKVMNERFINIKIDREERPDIDQIYMDAVQMMTGRGGWPLNVVALPDGRPFWGATYVKKEDWMKVLIQLSDLYTKEPNKVIDYARDLAQGIREINLIPPHENPDLYTKEQLRTALDKWTSFFDLEMGGYKRAPKFMMPVNLDFLLHYAWAEDDLDIQNYLNLTLTKMAYGGIYDQLGGGFSRYSVDAKWHVPHFEKMLYDNGQLVSLYAKAYAYTQNELYRKTVEETIAFVARELTDESGAFYSSLDADSNDEAGNLEEGAYYVWKAEELQQILGDDFPIFKEYYNINPFGFWEEGKFVLIRNRSDAEIAKTLGITVSELTDKITESKSRLFEKRAERERPRLDDKILASWNGLMLKGLVDAYKFLGNKKYLDMALKNASFIADNMMKADGGLFHNHKEGKSTLNGYLEDYASVIDAFLGIYEVTFDEQWLKKAESLAEYCLENFYDDASGLFYFTSKQDEFVIRRTLETNDNVIPASNSIMAKNLFYLSKHLYKESYEETALNMMKAVQGNFDEDVSGYANWLHLVLFTANPFYEVAILGPESLEDRKFLQQNYLPNSIMAGALGESNLPLLEKRYVDGETFLYVCQKGSCKLPVSAPTEALKQIQPRQNSFF